jgi:hypothetical protein
MKLSIGRGLSLFCALLVGAAAPVARGDVLSGTLEFQFSGDDQILDFGQFSDCDTVSDSGLVVTLCLELDMAPNAKGSYEGEADLTFTGDIEGTLNGPASGKVRGKDAGSGTDDPEDKASFKLKADGDLHTGIVTVPTSVTVTCKGKITGDVYDTLCTVNVKIEGYGSASQKGVPYSAHIDGGNWNLTITINAVDDTHYSGVASDSLGYFYVVKGTYSPSRDESKLTLKGLDDGLSNGAKIYFKNLVSNAADTGDGDAKYKVQGYKGRAEVSTD